MVMHRVLFAMQPELPIRDIRRNRSPSNEASNEGRKCLVESGNPVVYVFDLK